MILAVFPLVLGSGIPLFEGSPAESGFRLEDCHSYPNGVVNLEYTRS